MQNYYTQRFFSYSIVMFKAILFLLVLILTQNCFTQTTEDQSITDWLKANNYFDNPDYLYASTTPKTINKPSENEKKILEEKEKTQAKKTLKSKISLELNDKEFDYIDFNNLEKYYVSFDRKTLISVCVINIKEVSEYWLKDIIREYDDLKKVLNDSQISGQLSSATIDEMLNTAKLTRIKLKRYEDFAFKLNPQIQMFEIELYKTDIVGKINELNNQLDKSIFNEKLKAAQQKLQSRNFYGAYASFKGLQWDYPNNAQVLNGLTESYNKLIDIYDKRITQLEQIDNYEGAMRTIDSLFKLDYDLEKEFTPRYVALKKKKFYSICNETEKLLSYKNISGEQLKMNMSQLKLLKDIDLNRYNKIKSNAESRLIDYDLKLIRSEVYNKNFTKALSEIPILKSTYEKSRKIEVFEKEIDHKIYNHFKNDLLRKRPNLYSIEPSVFMISPPSEISFIGSNYYNLNLCYSVGLFRRFGFEAKNKVGHFKYSTIGFKFDYLDARKAYNPNDSSIYDRNNSFLNAQLSMGFRNFVYLDLGYLAYENVLSPSLYTGGVSLYLPLGSLSLGVNAKYLTDFMNTNTIIAGAGIKFNLGLKKKFNSNDRDEIETSIMKLKQ